jgi:hypothetical protein
VNLVTNIISALNRFETRTEYGRVLRSMPATSAFADDDRAAITRAITRAWGRVAKFPPKAGSAAARRWPH